MYLENRFISEALDVTKHFHRTNSILARFENFILLLLTFFVFASCTSTHSNPREGTPPRILFLGLDGIGYAQLKKMQNGGHFRSFRPVSPMVSSFPSISDPVWALIMHTPLEPSYTREHFDQTLNDGKGAVVGGLMDHVLHPPRYESFFDFRLEGVVQHLASMTYAETTGLYWLDAVESQLLKSRGKKVFSAFIINTDFISHTKGEAAIFRYLADLDKKIEQLRTRYREIFGNNLEVILVSDHGNAFLKPKSIDAKLVLDPDGWRLNDTLDQDKDVVLVIPEILAFAPFFTKKGKEENLAISISRAEGVHVALAMHAPNQVDFFARAGRDRARVTIDASKKTLSYAVIKGQDPFDHLKYFKKNQSLSFGRYFQETLADPYPNALVRAWEGMTQVTTQAPSVLVSPHSGYVFSNKTLEILTKLTGLESVHGSFARDESLGIFMSTDRELPPIYPGAVLSFVQ